MSKLVRCWVLSLLLLSLFGCTQGPDYVRPAVESPVDWRVDYAAAADVSNMRWWIWLSSKIESARGDILG